MYEQIIKSRIQNVLEEIKFFSKTQAAYRRCRSTCDNLLILQEIFFHYRYFKGKNKVPIFLCFLDFRKAFDIVPRKLLFAKLAAIGVKGKILNVIIDLFTRTTAAVRVGDHESNSFAIQS